MSQKVLDVNETEVHEKHLEPWGAIGPKRPPPEPPSDEPTGDVGRRLWWLLLFGGIGGFCSCSLLLSFSDAEWLNSFIESLKWQAGVTSIFLAIYWAAVFSLLFDSLDRLLRLVAFHTLAGLVSRLREWIKSNVSTVILLGLFVFSIYLSIVQNDIINWLNSIILNIVGGLFLHYLLEGVQQPPQNKIVLGGSFQLFAVVLVFAAAGSFRPLLDDRNSTQNAQLTSVTTVDLAATLTPTSKTSEYELPGTPQLPGLPPELISIPLPLSEAGLQSSSYIDLLPLSSFFAETPTVNFERNGIAFDLSRDSLVVETQTEGNHNPHVVYIPVRKDNLVKIHLLINMSYGAPQWVNGQQLTGKRIARVRLVSGQERFCCWELKAGSDIREWVIGADGAVNTVGSHVKLVWKGHKTDSGLDAVIDYIILSVPDNWRDKTVDYIEIEDTSVEVFGSSNPGVLIFATTVECLE